MIKIMICDDHKILRDGLKALLKGDSEYEIVAEAGSGREALAKARKTRPDIIIMDIAMPGLNGIEATRKIKCYLPRSKILILSMHSSKEYVLEALKAGAMGYLMKETASRDLISAIHKIHGGEIYLNGVFSQYVIDEFMHLTNKHNLSLSKNLASREKEILQLVAEGKSNKAIASILNVSQKTVETHRHHIMNKLDIHDIAGLTKFAIRTGLVALE